jgi:hypothetical protein
MGRILVFLSLLFALPSLGATPAAVPSITIAVPGSQTQSVTIPLTSLSGSGVNGVFSLYSGNNSAATNTNFYPFYKNGVAYQVTAGKTAYCFNLTNAPGATPPTWFQLVSATASFAFNAASITSGVYQGGASAQFANISGSTSYIPAGVPGVYTFAASTYPGWQSANNQTFNIHMDCFEL